MFCFVFISWTTDFSSQWFPKTDLQSTLPAFPKPANCLSFCKISQDTKRIQSTDITNNGTFRETGKFEKYWRRRSTRRKLKTKPLLRSRVKQQSSLQSNDICLSNLISRVTNYSPVVYMSFVLFLLSITYMLVYIKTYSD